MDENCEFVVSNSSDLVSWQERMLQPRGDLPEDVVRLETRPRTPERRFVDVSDDERKRLLPPEALADRTFKGSRVGQTGQGVALCEEREICHQDSVSLGEISGDDADGHVGQETDS